MFQGNWGKSLNFAFFFPPPNSM